MELFKAITEARSAAIVVEKICCDNGISIDLTSPDGFGSQAGVLAELLGIEVWISLKTIQEANPWPNKLTALRKQHGSPTSQSFGFHPHDNDVQITVGSDEDLSDQIYAYQRFRRACLTMISIFDIVPTKLAQTKPQPTEEVVENFARRVLRMSVDSGPFRLLENGSIVHSVARGSTLKSPLFSRPQVTFQSFSSDAGVLLPDMETANSLRERMREIMIEAEERDNRRRKPKLKL
jgi:hypothetical protein